MKPASWPAHTGSNKSAHHPKHQNRGILFKGLDTQDLATNSVRHTSTIRRLEHESDRLFILPYPARTAPANSVTVAIIMACFIVNERDETLVAVISVSRWYDKRTMNYFPNEFATSFAPIFHASRNANSIPMAKI